jgi:hypothetical protein
MLGSEVQINKGIEIINKIGFRWEEACQFRSSEIL